MRNDIVEQAQAIRSDMEAAVEGVEVLTEQVNQLDEIAIGLYEANLIQEEINTAQDDALIELYEMIGG